jgi:anti-sigma-K factor RskA
MDTGELHDLTAAYALDALEPDERAAFAEHLRGCERCREEVAAFEQTAAALAYAAEAPPPPPEVRERLLEAARAERPNVVPLRPRWAVPAAAAAAVAACAALGLGLWAASLRSDLTQEREARAALAVLARPDARRVPLAGADGVAAFTPDGRAVLAFARLPEPPKGKTYQAWVIEDGQKPRPAGVFDGRTLVLTRSLPAGSVIAITVEPKGGSPAPTSPPFASAHV